MNKLLRFVLLCAFLCAFALTQAVAVPHIVSVQKIWDKDEFDGFTSLIRYQGLLFVAFRASNEHQGGYNGKIRLLASKEGTSWSEVAVLAKEGVDLRDPMLSQTPQGLLMLSFEGAVYNEQGQIVTRNPYVAFSIDGVNWGPLTDLGMRGDWLWRLTWHKGTGYTMSYHATDIDHNDKPWGLKLFKTPNGVDYDLITTFHLPYNQLSEATLRFTPSGEMVALQRTESYGLIGHAQPPFTDWQWYTTSYILGGPDFLILPNGEMWASTRKVVIKNGQIETSTIVAKMTLNSFEEVLKLPSGGDTGYPGMVYEDGKLLISYYSSHEGKASIYFAVVEL